MSALEVVSINPGASIQDTGRPGWKRFGIPPSGAMDTVSARWANLLVGNAPAAPVAELLFGRAVFRAPQPVTLALTGADLDTRFPQWRSFTLGGGEELAVGSARRGLWSYLAVAGGFEAERFFGSSSVNVRAEMGSALRPGEILRIAGHGVEAAIAGRFLPPNQQPSLEPAARLPIWKGPEWDLFPESSRRLFLETEWRVSSRSDRAGYRLDGPDLNPSGLEILSAPVPVGTVQVPAGGQPLVLMRDGPTVGGYPRMALLEPEAVSRFAQCAPGYSVRFVLLD